MKTYNIRERSIMKIEKNLMIYPEWRESEESVTKKIIEDEKVEKVKIEKDGLMITTRSLGRVGKKKIKWEELKGLLAAVEKYNKDMKKVKNKLKEN